MRLAPLVASISFFLSLASGSRFSDSLSVNANSALSLATFTSLVSTYPSGGFSLLLFMLGFLGILVLSLILIWRSSVDWILLSFNCEGGVYINCCSCFGYENSSLAHHIPLFPILVFHLAMRTLAWNCRGAGRASTVRALKELIR